MLLPLQSLHARPGARSLVWILAACALLWPTLSLSQTQPGIPEATLRAPWSLHLAVVDSLADRIEAAEPAVREPLADAMSILQVSLGEYETQFDRVIDRLIADPSFRYAATEVSGELARQVADIQVNLDAVYALLAVQERADVRQAQEALQALHRLLDAKTYFERDVLVGVMSRPQTVELATRWWNGEERAIALKKRVAQLREGLEGLPSSAR